MNPPSHPLPFELKAGEELLWSVDKQPHVSTRMGLMWGASILLLVLAGVCAAMDIAGNADGLLYLAALLLVLAILAAGTAMHERSSDRRIAYALSNRRAEYDDLVENRMTIKAPDTEIKPRGGRIIE